MALFTIVKITLDGSMAGRQERLMVMDNVGRSAGSSTCSENDRTESQVANSTSNTGSNNLAQPIVYYGRDNPGHEKLQCPDRVKRVKSPSRPPPVLLMDGCGQETVQLTSYTGADKSVVRADCVPHECFTGISIVLSSYDGKMP